MTTATATKAARVLGLLLTTALGSATLAGCAGKVAAPAALSAAQAEAAIGKGKGDKAVTLAEAAVLANPRDGATRALLGAAYVEAGRFASAVTALTDAMQLGDTSSKTVLTTSLALSALGRYAEAQALLAQHERNLDAADYGLAITLAGSPQQGIETLSNALRYGENTPKIRQNLAYAFALKGDWRSARLLAAQDLGADKLDARLGEWAQMAMPGMAVQRVASLLGVTPRGDAGQPAQLALANFDTLQQLASEPAATATPAPGAELASLDPTPAQDAAAPAAAAEPIQVARAEPFELPSAGSNTPAAPRIVLPAPTPSVAPVRVAVAMPKAKPVAAKPGPAFEKAFVRKPGAYSVQLGSFTSAAVANEAWGRFQKRHAELKGTERVVTRAVVGGKTFYRLAAAGFARDSAVGFCASVKRSGGGCLAYASARALPGAVPSETRVASR